MGVILLEEKDNGTHTFFNLKIVVCLLLCCAQGHELIHLLLYCCKKMISNNNIETPFWGLQESEQIERMGLLEMGL